MGYKMVVVLADSTMIRVERDLFDEIQAELEQIKTVQGRKVILSVHIFADEKPMVATPTPAQPTVYGATTQTTIEHIRMLFTKELEDMLNFSEDATHITIKPRQYLSSENFAKIAAIVRSAGGEYISAGKESRFRVKK